MFKKSLLFLLLMTLLAPWVANAQATLPIGTGTSYSSSGSSATGSGSAMGNCYNYYSTSQFIYTAEELGGAKSINSIAFNHNAYSMSSTVNIYLAHTTASTVDVNNPATEGTLVSTLSESTIGGSAAGWQTFNFSTPFEYNGTDNLLVVVCRTKYNSGWSNYLGWQYTATSDNKFMTRNSDSSGYDDITNTSYSYTAYANRPNVIIGYVPTTPYISLDPTSETVLVGLSKTITATYGNVSGTPTITYSSSNAKIASVSGSGTSATVTGNSVGTATITATMTYNATDYTATCAVTVEEPSYCKPSFANTSDYIESFTTTGGEQNIDNQNTGQGTGGYSNFYDTHFVSAEPDTEIGFSVVRGYDDNYNYAIWVDWNKDYEFDNTTEKVAYTTSSTGDWTGTFTIPTTAAAGDYHMRVLQVYSSAATPCVSASYGEGEDYKLTVIAASPYQKPVNLQVSNLTAATATITWEAPNSDVQSYKYQYREAGGSWSALTSTTALSAPLTVLTGNTTYEFQVQAIYAGNNESAFASTSFTTPCDAFSIDPTAYQYGFETADDMDCWELVNGVTNTAVWDNATIDYNFGYEPARTGDYCFMFFYVDYDDTDPEYQTLISPQLTDLPANGVHVEFYYVGDLGGSGQETFRVGYSTTDKNLSSFTWGTEITDASTAYQRFSANYPQGTKYVAVQHTSDDQYYLFLDDFTFEGAADCLEPSSVLADNITTTGASINWTAGGEETAWDIYVTDNSTIVPDDGTTPTYANISTKPYPLSGLTPATTYYVYVRAACKGTETSAWSTPAIFHTECEGMDLPYGPYGFEDGALSVCWNVINTNTSYNSVTVSNSNPNTGTYSLYFFRGSYDGDLVAVLPEVGTYDLSDYQFEFSAKGSYDGYEIYIGIMTDPDDLTTFVAQGDVITTTTSYAEHKVRFNEYTGSGKYVAIKVVRPSTVTYGSIYVDDIAINPIPSCIEPTGLAVTAPTPHGATFSWTAGGSETEWHLYFGKDATAPADDIDLSKVTVADANPFTLTTGLDAETTYYAWVRASCGGTDGNSEWAGGIEFMPSQYKNFTYQETASSSTGYVPVYGSYITNATNKGQILIPATYFPEEMADATVRRLTFYTTNSYPTADWGDAKFDVLVAEVAETSFATAAFFDWTEMTTVYSGSLSVSGNQMVIDLDTPFSYTGGNLVIGFNLTATGTNGYVQWVATYGSTYLAAYQYGTYSVSRSMYQPKTTFNYLPNPTPRPINPHPTEELSTEATVAWTAPNSTEVTGYQYQYKLATSTEWPTYYYDEIGLSATMTELTPEKTYDFRVRAVYPGPAYSQYAETQFTTTASCAIPDGLAAANLTQNTADLTWNASTEVLAYTVEYRTATTDAALFKEDFEDGIANWTFISMNTVNGIGGTGTYPAGIVSAAAHNSSNGGFRFSSYTKKESGDGVTYDQYLISHELTVTGDLKFYAWRYGTSDKLYYGTSTTTDDVDAFTWEELTFGSTQTWLEFHKEVTSGVKYIAFHYFGDYAFYAYLDDITIGEYTIPQGTWAAATTTASNTGAYTIEGLTAGTKYDVRVYANCAIDPETDNTLTTFTTLADHNIVFPETGVWNSTNFEPAVDPTVADNVIIRANVTIADGNNAYANNVTLENGAIITIENGATLTIKGTVTGGGSDKIIIEDGGQLIHNNSVYATVKKNITAPAVWKGTSDSDGWYLIATPLYSITISSVFTGVIDLFQYNEPAAYWYSYNNGDHTFTSMTRGAGYLHASQNTQTVSYAGSMIGTESAETKSLSYTSTLGDDVRGFNLIGNPFTRNLVLGDMTIGSTPVSTVYVVTDADRTKLTAYTTDEYAIAPGEGFFVQSTATSQTLTMNPAAKDEFEFKYIKIVAGNENDFDNAYVQIGNGNTLRKMNIANKMEVYVINNDEDYAAARVDELQGKIPVNFKAVADGEYTITVNANNLDVNMMLLLDNFSGEFIDLLENPSYTFKATTDDSEARFTLVFDCNNNTGIDENYTGNIFAYQYDNEIIVNGEGTLLVYDMMGRFMGSYEVNGSKRISASQFSNAVYIFRMVGETIQTQKIVVR